MTTTTHRPGDRVLRIVMWLDAFLSVAFVAAGLLAVPIVAAVGVPPAARTAAGLTALVAAVLPAGFGAVTAVALSVRMRGGDVTLPLRLWLPLPPAMRPPEYRRSSGAAQSAAAPSAAGEGSSAAPTGVAPFSL